MRYRAPSDRAVLVEGTSPIAIKYGVINACAQENAHSSWVARLPTCRRCSPAWLAGLQLGIRTTWCSQFPGAAPTASSDTSSFQLQAGLGGGCRQPAGVPCARRLATCCACLAAHRRPPACRAARRALLWPLLISQRFHCRNCHTPAPLTAAERPAPGAPRAQTALVTPPRGLRAAWQAPRPPGSSRGSVSTPPRLAPRCGRPRRGRASAAAAARASRCCSRSPRPPPSPKLQTRSCSGTTAP